jgi:sec-independent protein translocase protein TatA
MSPGASATSVLYFRGSRLQYWQARPEAGLERQVPMWDSPMHLLIIAVVILVLFGGRKIPEVMRGLGQGVREFKEGMRGDQTSQPNTPPNPPPSTSTTEEKK